MYLHVVCYLKATFIGHLLQPSPMTPATLCWLHTRGHRNQPFWMPAFIYSQPSVQFSFGNYSHEGTQEKLFQMLGMEHMIKNEVLWEHCFGSLCALGSTKESRPCNAMVGAAQNCQLINQAVNWTEKGYVVFELLLCRNMISWVQTVPLTDVFN